MLTTNFHTHTLFCDGCDSAASIAEEAKAQGLTSLGFSGHSPLPFPNDWAMKKEDLSSYLETVEALKSSYAPNLSILCGVEQDMLSGPYDRRFSYAIGAMHYLKKGDLLLPLDESIESFKQVLHDVYFDDYGALCRDYYTALSHVLEESEADAVAHLDLITKYKDILGLETPPGYYEYAEGAIEELLRYQKPFEINTGAIARGYKSTPYPDEQLLSLIFQKGGRILFSSDCHRKEGLLFGFLDALSLSKRVGFTSHTVFTDKGCLDLSLPSEE